jgi:DNA invertase Pin-like site-specific DNA recombinase
MLTVLGGVAEFERDLIGARASEARDRAKARGVKLGRKPKLTERQKRKARRPGQAGARDRPQLQRQPQHDFKAHDVTRANVTNF